MSRLRERYQSDVIPELRKEFGYANVMAVPKLDRIVVNMGLGEATQNAKLASAVIPFLPTHYFLSIPVHST